MRLPTVKKIADPVTSTQEELAVITGPALDQWEREQAAWNERVGKVEGTGRPHAVAPAAPRNDPHRLLHPHAAEQQPRAQAGRGDARSDEAHRLLPPRPAQEREQPFRSL